jgi:hypothetical protein
LRPIFHSDKQYLCRGQRFAERTRVGIADAIASLFHDEIR